MRQIVRYFILLVLSLLVTTIVLSLVFSRSLLSSLGPVNGLLARLDNIFSSSEDKKIEPRPEKTVRLIEGWTSRNMGQYFESQGIWQSEEFLEFVGFPQIDYNKKKICRRLKIFLMTFLFCRISQKIAVLRVIFTLILTVSMPPLLRENWLLRCFRILTIN